MNLYFGDNGNLPMSLIIRSLYYEVNKQNVCGDGTEGKSP